MIMMVAHSCCCISFSLEKTPPRPLDVRTNQESSLFGYASVNVEQEQARR